MSDDYDPLSESDSAPSISWKDVPVGTVQTLDVSRPCGKPIHYRDFDSKELMYWQPQGRPTSTPSDRPVEQIVFEGVDKAGLPAALFVKVSGEQLFFKLKDAQKALGHRIGDGPNVDRIAIKITGRENPDSGKKQNQFQVRITDAGPRKVEQAGDPFGDDPWGDTPAASSAPAPSSDGFGDEPPF